jgi:translation initiation factor IF-2
MVVQGKTRIYDLARSLVVDSLPEKEKKLQQSNKTKQIIDICKHLGHPNKTPSSSIEGPLVAQVLQLIDKQVPLTSDSSSTNETEDAAAKIAASKKPRVLRRLPSEKTEEDVKLAEQQVLPIQEVIKQETQEEEIQQQEEEIVEEIKQPEIPSKPTEIKVVETKQTPPQKEETPVKVEQVQIKPATEPLQQPYRVAKPINTAFSSIRRKQAAPPKKGHQQQRGQFQPRQQRDEIQTPVEQVAPKEMVLTHSVTVKELAILLKIQEKEIIRKLFLKGIMRTVNQSLEADLMVQIAADFGCNLSIEQPKSEQSEDLASRLKELVDIHTADDQDKGNFINRPPVVTIMGHVDHGKTTLLDSIRKAKHQITSTESGGITQHIGAYQIDVKDYDEKFRKVTFLDTPGHEAFTALRARGAQVTDIAILVVAADDGVMPQTIEAISHAKAAGVPIIVAVNKIDKPDASPERILSQLIEYGVVVEDFGGTVVCSMISAKQQINLDDLLTKITLVADAELGEKLLCNPSSAAVGAVIEAALSTNRGPVATVLVQSGTLRKGDSIAIGAASGRVRAMFNDHGKEITEAPPATPVQILGLDSLPQAGDTFKVFKNAQEAKGFSALAKELLLTKRRANRGLEYFSSQVREGTAKELNVIIKADVQGSAEAVANELNKLSNDQTIVRIIHSAAGAVTENDINLASATNSIVVNFNSIVDSSSQRLATENNVPIYNYNIIYKITDAVQKALNGLLEPVKVEVVYGRAEIRQIFSFGKSKIAGCSVINGKITRGSFARVIRGKKEIVSTRIDQLKRFKDDVKEVQEGFECGISFDDFNDFLEQDIIESWGYELQERTN